MKSLLLLLLIAYTNLVSAKSYYVSNSGNDSNTGLTTASPWKTLAKVNSFTALAAGDQVLFNRGEVFYGKLIINKNGDSNSPITIGAYGTGTNPVITGFTAVSDWTNLGANIWESTSAVSSLAYTNMVIVNGTNIPMGRFPNTGYLIWQSHTGNVKNASSTLTSNALTGSPNWTGAEVVFNSTTYIVSRDKITAQSGGTLTYTTPNPKDLFQAASTYFVQSFIIQNDARTLDTTNEWYYNPSTKKLRIYNARTPSNVQIATVDTLVYLNKRKYITFDNISFRGANSAAIEANASTDITVQNCDFDFSGKNAIHGLYNSNLTNMKVENCTINHTNNNAIDVGISANAIIRQNTIKNTGIIAGMIGSGGKTGQAISAEGSNELIENNIIDSVGYCGIHFLGSNTIIRNNYVTNFCLIHYDGGAIYTWNAPGVYYSGIKISNNILLNGNVLNHGIYLDYLANGIEISGNTIAYCERGLYLNNSFNVQVLNNTLYSNDYAILLDKTNTVARSNIVMKNNILLAKTPTQRAGFFLTALAESMPAPFTADSNYYARPIDDNLTIQTNFKGAYTQRVFASWQSLNGQDAHSHKSPKTINDINDLRLEYNETSVNKTISLPYNYIDVKNVSYNGTITLAPYKSVILIKNGTTTTGNKSLVANAGADQVIALPANTAKLSGSGTDPDGTISTYAWTKISGPQATIGSPGSATTSLRGLTKGTYKLQLIVTDNKGASDTDTVQVIVTSENNLLPAVNPSNTASGLDYKYYEGTFKVLPSFASLTPVKTGVTSTPDISFAKRTYGYSFNFTGFISVPADGQYTFYTTSDDGSNLLIDNVLVVNNDGLHSSLEKSGTIGLQAGKHAISIGYTQGTGGHTLSVSYVGPGVIMQTLAASELYRISIQTLSMSANTAITNEAILSSTQVSVKAYPNPFVNYIEINITGGVAGEYKLMLVDASGKVLWTKNGVKNAGDFQQSINTSALQRGTYFVKMIQNNTNSVIKLVK